MNFLLVRDASFGVHSHEKAGRKTNVKNSRLFTSCREAAELVSANKKAKIQALEKEKRANELELANHELAFQNSEKENRASELIIANKELLFQNSEKEKRAAELIIANKELLFQNAEKEKRASELIIANKELAFQNDEKEKRAAELVLANSELHFQNNEKGKRAAELVLANQELDFQNREKEKRAHELIIANKELEFQNIEKENRATELQAANHKINLQNAEKEEQAVELRKAYDELKKAKQNTEFDRNNIKSLINNTVDLMWSVDTNYKFITFNQAFNEIVLKFSGRPVTKGGDALHVGFSEAKLAQYLTYYKRAFAGETFTETEFTGTPYEFWTEISFYPIKNEDKVIGTACFSRDITQSKKEEKHLKLLESVITNTPDSIFILKAESEESARIIFVNSAFTLMTGYSELEVLNKNPFLLTGPNSDLKQLKSCSEKIKKGESCEFEMIQYNKDGTQIWVNFEITAVLNGRGKVSHFIVIGRDYTEKLRNLQALKDQNLVLKDIARIQSHNVRGPLARVMGLTNLLIDHFDEVEKNEILGHLRSCSNELDDVITKIVRKTENAIQSNL